MIGAGVVIRLATCKMIPAKYIDSQPCQYNRDALSARYGHCRTGHKLVKAVEDDCFFGLIYKNTFDMD